MVDINIQEYGSVLIIAIHGEFCMESIKYAEELWNKHLAGKPEVIAIDCKDVSFIDSSAIGVLVRFYNNASESGIPLIFIGLGKRLQNVFKIGRLDTLFTIMDKKDFEAKYLPRINL